MRFDNKLHLNKMYKSLKKDKNPKSNLLKIRNNFDDQIFLEVYIVKNAINQRSM